MVKPKDAKVWNEDLVTALSAREHISRQNGKRDVLTWQKARQAIEGVRKDIYQFRNGNIVNLPTSLGKTAQWECEQIIRGVKSVLPDGFVPTSNINNGGHGASFGYNGVSSGGGSRLNDDQSAVWAEYDRVHGGGHPNNAGLAGFATPQQQRNRPAAAAAASSFAPGSSVSTGNPFANDHYMKSMKIRGGAFAILMTFRHSTTDVLTKSQICREAQQFCDEQMEANYMAGRTHGAWKAIDTLKTHNFVTEQNFRSNSGGRWRDAPHRYTLTRDGKLFIDALLATRPEAALAAGSGSGGGFDDGFGMGAGGGIFGSGGGGAFSPGRSPGAGQQFAGGPSQRVTNTSQGKNSQDDVRRLEEFVTNGEAGDVIEFDVGKDRRLVLHRQCDDLQGRMPNLVLQHGSSGAGRARCLKIQIVRKASSFSSPLSSQRKRPHSMEPQQLGGASSAKRPKGMTPAQAAAAAAERRLKEAKEKADLDRALKESAKKAPRKANDDNDEESMLRMAIERSLADAKKKPSDDGAIDLLSDSDDEPARKKRATDGGNNKQSSSAKTKNNDSIDCDSISSSSSDDEHLWNAGGFLKGSPARRKGGEIARRGENKTKMPKKSLSSPTILDIDGCSVDKANDNSSKLASGGKKGSNIDLSQSDEEVIEIEDSQETMGFARSPAKGGYNAACGVIEIEDSQDTMAFLKHTPTKTSKAGGGHLDESDDVICVDDDSVASPRTRQHKYNWDGVTLKVMIDNRERNRNRTPRELRLELQRHLHAGSLRAVLPPSMPAPQVEEVALSYGDFAYASINSYDSNEQQLLGVSVERKRVNDLVHRSVDGDHLKQLHRMRQNCSLSILLLEYDLKSASLATAYNAQNKEGFDPFDSTVENEEDIYRLFGRLIMMEGPPCKFIQAKDEQSSLRAVGAMGLMALSLEQEERTNGASASSDYQADDGQGLIDMLTEGGIPWQLSKQVAKTVGGSNALFSLYDSCPCEEAKICLLSHVLDSGDKHKLELNGSPDGWSEAIYRIVSSNAAAVSGDRRPTTGQGALLLYKEVLADHAAYLCSLYQGNTTPEEALELVLGNPEGGESSSSSMVKRQVLIELTEKQAALYFPTSSSTDTFYNLRMRDGELSSPIVMRTTFGSFSSKAVLVFEVQASDLLQFVLDNWDEHPVTNFVSLAQKISRKIDWKYRSREEGVSNSARVFMLSGLSAAFDDLARKAGYKLEMKAVVDMILSDLLLRTDVTIIQAQNKKEETKVKIIRQLALAFFHFGFMNASVG